MKQIREHKLICGLVILLRLVYNIVYERVYEIVYYWEINNQLIIKVIKNVTNYSGYLFFEVVVSRLCNWVWDTFLCQIRYIFKKLKL